MRRRCSFCLQMENLPKDRKTLLEEADKIRHQINRLREDKRLQETVIQKEQKRACKCGQVNNACERWCSKCGREL